MSGHFAHFDAATGRILGLYDAAEHTTIPQPAVEISPTELANFLSDQKSWRISGGAIQYVDATPDPAAVLAGQRATRKCSKLQAMRVLKPLGLWADALAWIAADPDRQEEWDLAYEIERLDALMEVSMPRSPHRSTPASHAPGGPNA